MDKQKLEEARQLAMSMTSHPVAFGTIEHTEKAGELLGLLWQEVLRLQCDLKDAQADADRFRWLAERTVATGLSQWVHPFQFLANAVDERRKAENTWPNVAGNRLAEGKSELTGLLGGPARSEKDLAWKRSGTR